jgi:hypothetical protein
MQKYFAFKLWFLLIIIVIGLPLKAQFKDCSLKLDSAKELFNSGQIEEIPSLLNSCLQNGFTKEQKIQADLLLIQVYLFDSNREKAEMVMTSFLRDFPDYKVQADDPVEFVELYKLFKINPTWGIGVTTGVNLPQISVLEKFSTENLNKLNSKYSPEGIGLDLGLHINRYFHKNYWISFDIQYSMINFKRVDVLGDGLEELKYIEKTGWLSAPLCFNFSFGNGQLSSYLFAGAEFGWLLTDMSNIARHNLINSSMPNVSHKPKNIRNTREPVSIWGKGGIGLQYKKLGGYFNLAIGYNYCLLPYNKGDNRYVDNDNLFYYQYIEDNFRINRFTCTLGYTKTFYRIKKKKE